MVGEREATIDEFNRREQVMTSHIYIFICYFVGVNGCSIMGGACYSW